jgi:hypothetical protein
MCPIWNPHRKESEVVEFAVLHQSYRLCSSGSRGVCAVGDVGNETVIQ